MHDDELVRLWRSQGDGPAASGEEILMDVKTRTRELDRKILWRDAREGVACLMVAAMAIYFAVQPDAGWTAWLGGLAMIGCCAWVYARLHRTRARHRTPREDLPLAARLRAEIDKVRAQEELLRSVGRWYVGPLAAGSVVWMTLLGLAIPLPVEKKLWAALLLAVASAAIMAVVGWLITRLNRHAADRQLEPMRRELEELLERVEAA